MVIIFWEYTKFFFNLELNRAWLIVINISQGAPMQKKKKKKKRSGKTDTFQTWSLGKRDLKFFSPKYKTKHTNRNIFWYWARKILQLYNNFQYLKKYDLAKIRL